MKAHKPGTRTIVVVNTVPRACELFEALKSANRGDPKREARERKPECGERRGPILDRPTRNCFAAFALPERRSAETPEGRARESSRCRRHSR